MHAHACTLPGRHRHAGRCMHASSVRHAHATMCSPHNSHDRPRRGQTRERACCLNGLRCYKFIRTRLLLSRCVGGKPCLMLLYRAHWPCSCRQLLRAGRQPSFSQLHARFLGVSMKPSLRPSKPARRSLFSRCTQQGKCGHTWQGSRQGCQPLVARAAGESSLPHAGSTMPATYPP